jgi:tetratricopeptide (TPR) repeat protein
MKHDVRSVSSQAIQSGTRILAAALLFAMGSAALSAQESNAPPPTPAALVEAGRKQLAEAQAKNTAEAYQKAEDLFNQAVQLDPKSGLALAYRGLAKFGRAGIVAQAGDFTASGQITQDATNDLDTGVKLAPTSWQVRLLRGLSYAQFPSFMGKGATAIVDLEFVVASADFSSQPGATRAHVWYHLGRLYAAAGQPEKARAAWQKSVDAAPESSDGKAAADEIKKMSSAGASKNSALNAMPDRFPQLRDDLSPIIVAASFTLPGHNFTADPSTWHPRMIEFMDGLVKQPGLLAMHRLVSIDHPGMIVILTWWKDKKAVNDWYYSDTHQGIIQWIYNSGGSAQHHATAPDGSQALQTSQATQIAMELFTTLPGGMQFGGGIGPKLEPISH